MIKSSLTTLFFLLFWSVIIGQKVHPSVYEAFKTKPKVPIICVVEGSADVSKAFTLRGKVAKSEYVFHQLNNLAEGKQELVSEYLTMRGIMHKRFKIVNAISASLTLDEVNDLTSFSGVEMIYYDQPISNDLKNEEVVVDLRSVEPEWGIKNIKADSVWQLGFQGQGVVIGGQDTGYDWDVSPLISKYRGWLEDTVIHSYNWHDAIHERSPLNEDDNNPCGFDSPEPCDDHNHGTHTMGTMVGSDDFNSIGVAPEAQWIGCRNMERGDGQPSTYLECFEWFLAPTGFGADSLPNPTLAPHVINNSWSCTEEEGCNPDNWSIMEQAVINLKAAGVFVVVSAGNDGPNCSTVNNAAAFFGPSFTVGATTINDEIAGFSSRGPVLVDSSFRIKPDVTAPGVGVRSVIRGGEFRNFNGTSMAGPHVAGAVALILSANPQLEGEVETIEHILRTTARPMEANQLCGDGSLEDVPNNVFGFGIINVLEAVKMAQTVNLDDLNLSERIFLYPNPTSTHLFIDHPIDVNISSYLIFDNAGNLVKSIKNIQLQASFIDVESLPVGMYYIEIQTDAGRAFEKFVKIH